VSLIDFSADKSALIMPMLVIGVGAGMPWSLSVSVVPLEAAQQALEGLRDAEQQLASRRSEPVGRVKIDLPAGFGHLLLPTFVGLREKYPGITLEVALTDRMSDPIGEGWDVVVRIGVLPETSELTVRKLCDLRLGLYAAPKYLQRRGAAIKDISELGSHDAVVFRGPTGRLRPWSLKDADGVRDPSARSGAR